MCYTAPVLVILGFMLHASDWTVLHVPRGCSGFCSEHRAGLGLDGASARSRMLGEGGVEEVHRLDEFDAPGKKVLQLWKTSVLDRKKSH